MHGFWPCLVLYSPVGTRIVDTGRSKNQNTSQSTKIQSTLFTSTQIDRHIFHRHTCYRQIFYRHRFDRRIFHRHRFDRHRSIDIVSLDNFNFKILNKNSFYVDVVSIDVGSLDTGRSKNENVNKSTSIRSTLFTSTQMHRHIFDRQLFHRQYYIWFFKVGRESIDIVFVDIVFVDTFSIEKWLIKKIAVSSTLFRSKIILFIAFFNTATVLCKAQNPSTSVRSTSFRSKIEFVCHTGMHNWLRWHEMKANHLTNWLACQIQ